ncbi:MAG: Holliday junction branch migration protein RuvA [Ilumatobacteraceae bacterium]|jgi:Holliday junction DNA helicase RuvA|nr:Holliday junction branch migration protein RuvA [Ilumatobacteraceae bacterium]
MIGSLRGCVVERRHPNTVLLEVSGVGYLCAVTPPTFAELEPTTTVYLHVHHHIREDAQTLYGFVTRDEKETFEQLISVHGVGPALALSILAVHSPHSLVDVVATSNLVALTLVPGVGKKTAERLLVELKNKITSGTLGEVTGRGSSPASIVGSVREALIGLGYGNEEIRDVLRDIGSAGDAEALLRDALTSLGARRA